MRLPFEGLLTDERNVAVQLGLWMDVCVARTSQVGLADLTCANPCAIVIAASHLRD